MQSPLRNVRKAHGFTLQHVAAGVQVNPATLSRIERTQDDLTCAQWLWKKIIALYEQAAECDGEVVRPKEPNWTAWANEIRLMCVQDGRTHKQICEMYSRVSRDPFWCRNVLSPSKLREKWDELSLRLSPSVSTHTEKREDPYFKASYDNVDYSQIPAGFRG